MTSRNRRAARRALTSAPAGLRAVWATRLVDVAQALGRPCPMPSEPATEVDDLLAALPRVVDLTDRAQVWLALATLSGTFPEDRTVVDVTRACEFDGSLALWTEVARYATPENAQLKVRVAVGQTLVDVNHTVGTDLATGIQRVARETASRWFAERPCTPVAWTAEFGAFRELTDVERARVDKRAADADANANRGVAAVVVPWCSTVLVPELAAEHPRSRRLLALARYSGNRTGVIGFDCVPLTSAETTAEGFAAVFFGNLAAVRHFDRVAAISGAAALEYEGWRHMLGAVGLSGPSIRPITLPAEAPEPTLADLEEGRARFVTGELPLVLVVGSHEPRKNHLAVLHAAEICWRQGDKFTLTFIGGHSWASAEFQRALAALQLAGRPVEAVSKLPDHLLWAAYRLARFTVFPSLNEGFGLPVAESLAAGTPVVTSCYGSMREIGEDGGAVLVDPRQDHEIAASMARLLRDDEALAVLETEARARTFRTWDDYAADAWAFLTAESPE